MAQIFVLDAHLRDGDGKINGPPICRLREEDKGNHQSLICRLSKSQKDTEDNHEEDGCRQLPVPMSDSAAKEAEQQGTEGDGETLNYGQDNAVPPICASASVEDGDHSRPEN